MGAAVFGAGLALGLSVGAQGVDQEGQGMSGTGGSSTLLDIGNQEDRELTYVLLLEPGDGWRGLVPVLPETGTYQYPFTRGSRQRRTRTGRRRAPAFIAAGA